MPLLLYVGALGDKCNPAGNSSFLSFPHWYKYLYGVTAATPGSDLRNGLGSAGTICSPSIQNINDVWLIAAAVIEILLRVAALVAVLMVIYGAITYTTSQGVPEKTSNAKDTITNALVGLAIAIMSAAIVSFIAGSVK